MTLEERVAWSISLIKGRDKKLNNVSLGKILCVNKNTVGEYSQGRGDFKGCALAGIVKNFGISGEWLISGRGEPFPGATKEFPEVCGPPGVTKEQEGKVTAYVKANIITPSHINDNGTSYGSTDLMFSSNQKLNIEEAMGKTYKVLSAGTALSVALYMNIQQFATALDTGIALQLCQDQMKVMQEQIDILNRKVDGLTARPTISEGQGDGSEKQAM